MIKTALLFFLVFSLVMPVSALEIEAPPVPASGSERMPDDTSSFGESVWEIIRSAVKAIRPDLADAASAGVSLIAAAMVFTLVSTFQKGMENICKIAGCCTISYFLLRNAGTMIRLGAETIRELSDYGKLFYPVMTAALAAQGGVTTSAALYAGTAFFCAFISNLLSGILIPAVYLFLGLSAGNRALGEDMLKKMADLIKNGISWCLKTILTVFTTYMSITGVVSGTTDAAALKAAKVTISSVVPVVGGILSDSSEAILISAGILKNAAGIYGILAILAVFIDPFLQIGCQYLLLKITAAISSIFAPKDISGLIEDFSSAMGLMVAMTGAVCVLLLIGAVCFMKGVG